MDPTPQQILFTHLHRLKTLEIDERMIQQQILELHIKIENRKQLFKMIKTPSERDTMEHSYEITVLQCEIEVLRCKERRANARFEIENSDAKKAFLKREEDASGPRLKKLAQTLSTLGPESD
jgi:hypothetical protein